MTIAPSHVAVAGDDVGRPRRGPHVAVLLPSLRLGGAERLVVETFRVAHAERHPERYTLVVLSDDAPEIAPEELRALGVEVVSLGIAARVDPRAVLALRSTLARLRPDVVHSHLPRMSVLTRLALLGLGLPHVYTEHNVPEAYLPGTRHLNRWSLGLADVVVAVSAEVADAAVRSRPGLVGGTRVRVIPNGVDGERLRRAAAASGSVRRELGVPVEAPVIGLLAHFRPQKAHDLLLRSVARLQQRDVHVLLAGRDDGTEAATRQLAEALRLTSRVHFLGPRSDAPAVLRALDLLVMPSYQEGLPVALLEAMALGVPVLASRAGGIPQVVRDGHDGVLVPVGDEVALVAALSALLADPARRADLGARGRVTVDTRFSLGEMVRAYRAVYASLAGAR